MSPFAVLRPTLDLGLPLTFFVFEATLFLFLDQTAVKARWLVFPLALLAYLPIRFVLQVLTQPGRAEAWAMVLAFGYLLVRIGAAW